MIEKGAEYRSRKRQTRSVVCWSWAQSLPLLSQASKPSKKVWPNPLARSPKWGRFVWANGPTGVRRSSKILCRSRI